VAQIQKAEVVEGLIDFLQFNNRLPLLNPKVNKNCRLPFERAYRRAKLKNHDFRKKSVLEVLLPEMLNRILKVSYLFALCSLL